MCYLYVFTLLDVYIGGGFECIVRHILEPLVIALAKRVGMYPKPVSLGQECT